MVAKFVSPIITKEFGRRHRQLRKVSKISQVTAAKAYGISQGSLSKMETGVGGPSALSSVSVAKISKLLNVSPERLFLG